MAVTRKDPENDEDPAFIPEERISLEDAIAAFTINAAYTNHRDADAGSIEVGKLADLVVLDQDLFAIEPERISDTRAVLTLFEGHPVHGNFEDLQIDSSALAQRLHFGFSELYPELYLV